MAKQQAKQAKPPVKPVTGDASKSKSPLKGSPAPVAKDEEVDAEDDHVYGLASVLYHALKAADAARKYQEDARKAGAEDLLAFFQECQEEAAARAKQAKALLISASDDGEGEDEDDEDDEDEEDDEDDET